MDVARAAGWARFEPILNLDHRWIAVVVGFVTLLTSLLFGSAMTDHMESEKKIELNRQLRYIAKNAAQFVDGNMHRKIRLQGSMASKEYAAANSRLRKVLTANEQIQYVYTCYFENGAVKFGLDPTEPGDHNGDGREDQSKLGELYADPTPELLLALQTDTVQVERKPSTDEWGTFISAYAPVFDDKGDLEAVVGVDLSLAQYQHELATVFVYRRFAVFASFFLATCAGLASLWMLGRVYGRLNELLRAKQVLQLANSELESLNVKLDWQNRTDALTGLLNRTGSMLAVKEAIAEGHGQEIAIALMDLDRFKVANDHFGHAYGDQYLIAFSEALSLFIHGAIVGRLGGDEFMVARIGPNATAILEENLAAFQKKLAEEVIFVGLVAQSSTASIGIASGVTPVEPEELIRHADIAMYEAKRAGMGQRRIYEDSMGRELERRVELERELRLGWESGEFWMAIQPIVEIRNGMVVAGELLMRWNRADGTPVSPMEFVPAAEETGLIHEMGLWAIEEACRYVERLERELPGQRIHLSVNVSAKQLNRGSFVETVREILGRYEFHRGGLWFEITESSLISEGQEAIDNLKRIREMGIMVALDDFGTGYSSLSMLMHLPLDCLKIDRSFIRNVTEDESSAALVQTILKLSALFGLYVVAEGIEHAEQGQLVGSMGCQWGQGFHYSRPVPISDFVDHCRSGQRAA